MFEGLYEGWENFKQTLVFAVKNPLLLFPMLLAVCGIVGTIYYGVEEYNLLDQEWYIIIIVYVVVVTFITSVCSLILLELIEQKEQGRRMNPVKAVFDTLVFDLWRTLPVIIVWSVLKFILTVIEIMILIAKSKSKEKRSSYRTRNSLRRTSTFMDMLQTGVRLAAMTILTSIAWEPLNPFKAFSKGIDVYEEQISQVVMGVGLSNLFKAIMFIPSLLAIYVTQESSSDIQGNVMIGVMIYFGFVWAISLMVEQVYVAELYMWNMVFERERDYARENNKEVPKSMYYVNKPSLFDEIPDFKEHYDRNKKEKY